MGPDSASSTTEGSYKSTGKGNSKGVIERLIKFTLLVSLLIL